MQPAGATDPERHIDLTTPLSELARWKRPPGIQTVAVSLSNAPDTEIYGGSPEHLATFADDLVLYLLIAGLRVAYGGVLGHDALQKGAIEGDDINYVERLLGDGPQSFDPAERRRRQAASPHRELGRLADPLQVRRQRIAQLWPGSHAQGPAASARPRRHGGRAERGRQRLRASRHAGPALRLGAVVDLHARIDAGENVCAE